MKNATYLDYGDIMDIPDNDDLISDDEKLEKFINRKISVPRAIAEAIGFIAILTPLLILAFC